MSTVVGRKSMVISRRATRAGFSLIEIMIVAGIVATISVVALVSLFGRRNLTQLNTTGQQVVTLLREAQSRSMSGSESGATWGVYLENSTSTAPFYALYKNTYSSANTLGYYRLPPNVQFVTSTLASGASTTITFTPISGLSSVSTTISLRLVPAGTLYTINISSFGSLAYSTSTP